MANGGGENFVFGDFAQSAKVTLDDLWAAEFWYNMRMREKIDRLDCVGRVAAGGARKVAK